MYVYGCGVAVCPVFSEVLVNCSIRSSSFLLRPLQNTITIELQVQRLLIFGRESYTMRNVHAVLIYWVITVLYYQSHSEPTQIFVFFFSKCLDFDNINVFGRKSGKHGNNLTNKKIVETKFRKLPFLKTPVHLCYAIYETSLLRLTCLTAFEGYLP